MLPALIRNHSDKRDQIVQIQQRFPGAHHDYVRHPLFRQLPPDPVHLSQHFPGCQIPYLPAHGARAERAPHCAPDLGRNAHRIAVLIPHQHRFDPVSVPQRKQIFSRPVQPRLLHHLNLRQPDRQLLCQLLAQRLRQIRHLIIIRRQLFMQPAKNLFCPETGLAKCPQIILQCFAIHAEDVRILLNVRCFFCH